MVQKSTQALADLYRADETAWLDAMAELIRSGQTDGLDFANLAEFLAENASRDRTDNYLALTDFLAGALVWNYRTILLTPSQRGEILGKQFEFENWTDTATLYAYAESVLPEAYHEAIERASDEIGVPPSTFPKECPWTIAQMLAGEVLHR